MNAEIIYNAINIGSMLLGTLIAYGIIPIPVSEEKSQKWNKGKNILKIICPIGLLASIVVALSDYFAV